MPYAKVTLFDIDGAGNMGQPVVSEMSFEYSIDKPHQKVSVTVADDQMACAGTIVMPMQVLGQLVEAALKENAKAKLNIIMPHNGIILPN